MASKRVSISAVNWAEFASKIPEAQRGAFNALKNKQDGYVRAIAALPDALPKIDFAAYKAKVAVTGMVDNFQKSYDALKVPYPKDTMTSTIDSQAVAKKSAYEKFVAESKTRIEGIKEEQAKWEAMMPIEDMTREDALDYVPHLLKANPDKPNMWPFDETLEEHAERVKNLPRDGHH